MTDYLRSQQEISILLLGDKKRLGVARFSLSEFLSTRVHRINYLRYFDLV